MDINQPLDRDFAEGLQLSSEAKSFLQEAARWSRFLAILGFIFLGMIVLMGVFAGTLLNAFYGSLVGIYATGYFTVFFIIMAAIYFFPVLYLYRFSTNMLAALKDDDEIALTTSFSNLKSHYKFIGILTAIMIGFHLLSIGFAILAAIFASN